MKFFSNNTRAFFFIISILPFLGFGQNKSFKVTLDAGHGGKDFGAVYSGHVEKNIALAVTLKVGKILEGQSGVNVNYTRKTDVFIDLIERANIANKIDANIFVSIHCNANKNTEADGTETYVMGMTKNASSLAVAKSENSVVTLEKDYKEKYEGYDPNSPETMIGLTLMQEEFMENSISLASKIEDAFSALGKKIRGGGVKQAPYMVLHKSYMPRVLIEMGFISNPTEGAILDSEEGQDEIAKAIASAIMKYKKEYFGGNALADEIKPSKFLSDKEKLKSETATETSKKETKEVKDAPKKEKESVKEEDKSKKTDTLISKAAEVEAAKKAKLEAMKIAKEKALKDKADREAAVLEAKKAREEAKKAKELEMAEAKKASLAVPNKKNNAKDSTELNKIKDKETTKSIKDNAKKVVEKLVEKEVEKPTKVETKKVTEKVVDKEVEKPAKVETKKVTEKVVEKEVVKPVKEETKKIAEKVVEKVIEKSEVAPIKERKETNASNTVIFKVQIAASIKKIDLTPANFKGLQMISMNVEDDIYKYMYQSTNDYEEARKYLEEVKLKGYTSAFLVAFRNGEKISIKEAIAK